MRIQEITENYFDKLGADATNLLMTAQANNEKEIDTYENRIFEILRSSIENPPSRETLTATLDRLELDQSDLGAGNYPLGLQLFGRILPSTIYRDDPLNLFRLENIIGSLRSRLSDENFFPNLIKKILF